MAAPEVLPPETDTTSALVLVEKLPLSKMFERETIDPILERIKVEVRAVETDISTETGRRAVASLSYKVAKTKTFIDAQRKVLVSDEKKRLAAIDKEGKRIWDELESLQHEVRKPLTDWEDAEKKRIADHEAALSEVAMAGPYTLQNWQALPLDAMRERLAEIRNDGRDWQEFKARADYVSKEACRLIEEAIAKREKYDSEQVELARLRAEAAERERREREARIAREAAERAQHEAEERARKERERWEREAREREAAERAAKEKAEQEKREAEERAVRAEAERQAAIEKAKRDTEEAERRAKTESEAAIRRERERVEREQREAAEALAKREADRNHRARINREAAAAFAGIGFDEDGAKSIVELIAKGGVPHVRIEY